MREGYSSHFVSHFFILEKTPFSELKLTSVQSKLLVQNDVPLTEKSKATLLHLYMCLCSEQNGQVAMLQEIEKRVLAVELLQDKSSR